MYGYHHTVPLTENILIPVFWYLLAKSYAVSISTGMFLTDIKSIYMTDGRIVLNSGAWLTCRMYLVLGSTTAISSLFIRSQPAHHC
jgi:hypothetical protein